MIYSLLAIVAVVFFFYSISIRQLERAELTGPMLFVALGGVLGVLYVEAQPAEFTVSQWLPLVELTLAVFLFTDAAKTRFAIVRAIYYYPILLLAVALPLTFLAITLVGLWLFPELSLFAAALLAIILSPTDAALSKGFLESPAVPAQLKEAINIESGLNDGLCVPIFLFLFASWQVSQWQESGLIALYVVKELGIALLCALALSTLAIGLLKYAQKKHYFELNSSPFLILGLAVAIFCITQQLHGSGFVAVFITGLLFDRFYSKGKNIRLITDSEHIAEFFALLIWCLFGVFAYLQLSQEQTSWQMWLFALLAATLLRVIPVLLTLKLASKLSLKHSFTLAWFGPRGLASIVFTLMVLQHSEGLIAHLATLTILCSVFIHGITTRPIANSFTQS